MDIEVKELHLTFDAGRQHQNFRWRRTKPIPKVYEEEQYLD